MAIFSKTKAAISPPPTIGAAGMGSFAGGNAGANMIGQYYSYFEGPARNAAQSVPAISRSRDLLASTISCMKLKQYTEMWNGEEMEQVAQPPRSWFRQLDPNVSNNFLFSWLVDDLFYFGRCMLHVESRYPDGLPRTFTRIPIAMVTTLDQQGPVYFAPSNQVMFQGAQLRTEDCVQILGGIQGIIYSSEQSIGTTRKLEAARFRNASSAIPAGVLQVQAGSEPLSSTELADLAASFNAARATNQTAALSPEVHYIETATSPDKMLLIDASEFQVKEMANLCGVPPYLLGANIGSYSYTTAAEARELLWTFGARPFADAIASALSMCLPAGSYVEFDVEDYLAGEYGAEMADATNKSMANPTPTTMPGVISPS